MKGNSIMGINKTKKIILKRRILFRNHIIGVDEVGRGPLAGRVFVGAVLFPKNPKNIFKKTNAPAKLSDSKKLSLKQRKEWFNWIKKNNISFAIAASSSSIIDKINVSKACNLAAQKAIEKIIKKNKLREISVIADAGIKINKTFQIKSFKSFPKADEKIPAVSLASIVAKILRDREMEKLHKKYPKYGFDSHKGYGTRRHIKAIKKYGPSPIHRLTFISEYHNIKLGIKN